MVTLVTGRDAARAAEAIGRAPRVAVDTEFHAERRYVPQLYLIQVHAEGGDTWIVDALDFEAVTVVAPALRSVPWVVHGGQQDVRLLTEALDGAPGSVSDTQVADGLVAPGYPAPYGALVERHLGVALAKAATLSDWSRRPLAPEQIAYAAADVELLLPLWDRLAALADEAGRARHLRAACDEARAAALDGVDPGEAWRDVAASASLTRQQAAVLQELAAWREEVARRDDQPARAVLGDALLAELARRQPTTIDGLSADRRMPRAVVKRLGAQIVERVARAAARPEWAWPRVLGRATPESRVVAWLQAFVEHEGRRERWGARLVLPPATIERLALDPARSREDLAARLGAWRDAIVGDRLWDALNGRLSLRLDGGDVVAEPR